MTDQRSRYLAYMLRLWEVRIGSEQTWRASLESPHTGERHGFADLQALFAFLEERTGCLPRRRTRSGDPSDPAQMRSSHEPEDP
ncbi:MAG TPA: hypothetical protein G4O02_18400 [Caldilineae bacterium]|jgi:hypothetical protein|nr:hypothetical protein [Caldilineae bacterium]